MWGAAVVGLPGLVASEDVVAFIPDEGLAVDGARHDEEQRDDGDAVEGDAGCDITAPVGLYLESTTMVRRKASKSAREGL